MNDGMTPREHDDVRSLLLAGAQRIRPAASRRTILSAAVSLIVVAGVVGGVATAALSNRAAPIAGVPSETATPTPLIPALCVKYAASDLDNPAAGEPIAVAGARATLDDDAMLSPGISVRESATVPGTFDAVARVCSAKWDRDRLIAAATAIAAAIQADPAHATLTQLTVAPWVPISSDALAQDPNTAYVTTVFPDHPWEQDPSTLVSAWQ